jgi:hypothetical protein
MQNHFITLIENGKISSARDLKKLFWKLALKCHPDSGDRANGEELFKKLKADYDAAERFLCERKPARSLRDRQGNPGAEGRSPYGYGRAFADLVASNFPVAKSVRAANKSYLGKLASFAAAFENKIEGGGALVTAFEQELYEIRGENIVWNELYGKIVLIFYNVCSYYHSKSILIKKAVPKWFEEIRTMLHDRGCAATLKVLGILIDDMEHIRL